MWHEFYCVFYVARIHCGFLWHESYCLYSLARILLAASQPVSQPANLPTFQPASKPASQPGSQPGSQLAHSIGQCTICSAKFIFVWTIKLSPQIPGHHTLPSADSLKVIGHAANPQIQNFLTRILPPVYAYACVLICCRCV